MTTIEMEIIMRVTKLLKGMECHYLAEIPTRENPETIVIRIFPGLDGA